MPRQLAASNRPPVRVRRRFLLVAQSTPGPVGPEEEVHDDDPSWVAWVAYFDGVLDHLPEGDVSGSRPVAVADSEGGASVHRWYAGELLGREVVQLEPAEILPTGGGLRSTPSGRRDLQTFFHLPRDLAWLVGTVCCTTNQECMP